MSDAVGGGDRPEASRSLGRALKYGLVFGFVATVLGAGVFLILSLLSGTDPLADRGRFAANFLRFFAVWVAFGTVFRYFRST